jgi:hypothetical protein
VYGCATRRCTLLALCTAGLHLNCSGSAAFRALFVGAPFLSGELSHLPASTAGAMPGSLSGTELLAHWSIIAGAVVRGV